jgi:DNA-binding response OmpR family regulator
MLTAEAQKKNVLKGLKKGASDYVLKPYKFTELLLKIKNLIG